MIRNLLFQVLYHLRISSALQWMNRSNGRFPILVFHRVSPHADPFWPPLSVQSFEKILILLKKNYTVLPLESILECTNKQLSKACFITFDDGFEDTFTWARPLLLKHAVPASFFIPTSCLTSGKIIWPLQLRNSLSFTVVENLDLNINNKVVSFRIVTQQEKIKAFVALLKYLSAMKEKEFLSTLSYIFGCLGKFEDQHIRIMNQDQLSKLAIDFAIHSHTRNHYYLSALSKERVAEEFAGSIEDLTKWLPSDKPRFLAYPVGDYSEAIAHEAINYFAASFRVGDELAYTKNLTESHARMKIPRFNIHHESPYEVYALINGLHGFLRQIINPFISIMRRVFRA